MANGQSTRKRKNPVTVAGEWTALSRRFLQSRVFAERSPTAVKMLFELMVGLGMNAKNNGDLSAAPAVMGPRGWTSTASRVAALKELEEAGLIVTTRKGSKRRCALYAITLWPMCCDFTKLDHGPGCYKADDQERWADGPTADAPAKWHSLRKNEKRLPAAGKGQADMHPQRVKLVHKPAECLPATGAKPPISASPLYPLRDTFSRTPSDRAAAPGLPAVGCSGISAVPGRAAPRKLRAAPDNLRRNPALTGRLLRRAIPVITSATSRLRALQRERLALEATP